MNELKHFGDDPRTQWWMDRPFTIGGRNHIFHKNDAPNCVARSVIEPHSEASANPKRVPGAS